MSDSADRCVIDKPTDVADISKTTAIVTQQVYISHYEELPTDSPHR